MAVFFTVFYVFTVYATPEIVFGPLADYHMVTLLALVATIVSVPNIMSSGVLKEPPAWACLAFAFMVPVSIAAGGWLGGALTGLYLFLPAVLAFFLAAANFRTKQHLIWMVLAMFAGSVFFAYCGIRDVRLGVTPSPYIYDEGILRRIRGLGFVYDPNDFSQVLVSLVPLTFLWRTKNRFLNVIVVGVPIALLITGMFFTHSRGASVALMAILMLALRRKLGTVPAAIMAGGLFAATLAVGWSGGRNVSMEAGADRMDAWAAGLEFIKAHPIFGVGAGRFPDFYPITAHNTIVVCAAEIGLPGFFCWVLFVLTSLRAASRFGSAKVETEATAEPELDEAAGRRPSPPASPRASAAPKKPRFQLPRREERETVTARARLATAGTTIPVHLPLRSAARLAPEKTAEAQPEPKPGRRFGAAPAEPAAAVDVVMQLEVKRIAQLMLTAISGFLVAGWFLSRALSTWLFLYCGMVVAVTRMGRAAGLNPKREPFLLLLRYAAFAATGLLLVVYVLLRARGITGS